LPNTGFPGRRSVLTRFLGILNSGALGPAYLFVGPEGSGKEATALEIARVVNCPRSETCAAPPFCESCLKMLSFQHPDLCWLGPAPATISEAAVVELLSAKRENCFHQSPFAASSRISIGNPDDPGPLTIRALLRFLRHASFQGRYKVVVITDGHRLTDEAANAILKTLEEPPPASLTFLLTNHRTGLLPTILSRCQQVRFDPYAEDELAQLLTDYRGVPAKTAAGVARAADGNARKAMALLEPQAMALQVWAGELLDWIHARRAGAVHLAAEAVHLGRIPADMVPPEGDPVPEARDLAARRVRAIQLCEMLSLYYSELLSCRERGREWKPRLPQTAPRIRALAENRASPTLLRDIARVEATKEEIDRNLNIGLTMASLFQGLIDHAVRDQEELAARS
jgi:DNA polymerase-3 subunit delta'